MLKFTIKPYFCAIDNEIAHCDTKGMTIQTIQTVIYSDSWQDHLRKLKELFGRLRKPRNTARPTKCLLGASRMEFLGHEVGGDVITPS